MNDEYPVLAWVRSVQSEAETIGRFLEWLISTSDLTLCKYDPRGEGHLYPAHVNIEELIAQYHGIPYKQYLEERERLYRSLTEEEE